MSGTKEDQINYRIKKSQETFDDAKYDAAGGRWNACVNRLYYSSFAILTALLLKNNIEAKSHKGIRIQFNHHFVKTGLVTTEHSQLYSDLFEWRLEEDYADFIDFDEESVSPLIKEVEEFNKKILELVMS
jgi:uncharacterized protein (UPF0332 family)